MRACLRVYCVAHFSGHPDQHPQQLKRGPEWFHKRVKEAQAWLTDIRLQGMLGEAKQLHAGKSQEQQGSAAMSCPWRAMLVRAHPFFRICRGYARPIQAIACNGVYLVLILHLTAAAGPYTAKCRREHCFLLTNSFTAPRAES